MGAAHPRISGKTREPLERMLHLEEGRQTASHSLRQERIPEKDISEDVELTINMTLSSHYPAFQLSDVILSRRDSVSQAGNLISRCTAKDLVGVDFATGCEFPIDTDMVRMNVGVENHPPI